MADWRWPEWPELKPCPFCGGVARMREQSGPYYMWSVWAECKGCGAKTVPSLFGNNGTIKAEECSYSGKKKAYELASNRWNRREI